MGKNKDKTEAPTYRSVIRKAVKLMDRDFFAFEKCGKGTYRITASDQDAISETELYAEDLGDRLRIRTNIFNARECMEKLGKSREEVYAAAYAAWKEFGDDHAFVFDDDEDAMMHMVCGFTCDPEDLEPVMLACLMTDMFEDSSAITATLFGMHRFRPDEPETEE